MNKPLILGIDPDVKGSGLALYENGKLKTLCNATLVQLYDWLSDSCNQSLLVVMEDVTTNTATFAKAGAVTKRAQQKVSYGVGRNAQVGWHILEVCEHLGFEVIKKPLSSQWKKQKTVFERMTGWTGRSNEETRSAAYIGYLEAQKYKYK